MLTPYSLVMTARTGLAVIVPLAMLLAFTSAARGVFAEGLLFLGLSLVTAQLAIMALPWSRRNDTIKAVALFAVATAAVRSGLTGEPSFIVTVPAAFTGTLAVWFTLEIENWRRLARTYGDTSFAVIKIETERRFRRKEQAQLHKAKAGSEAQADPVKTG